MRIRKKAWVEPELNECKFFVKSPCDNIGKWHECFKEKQKIHLELRMWQRKLYSKNSSEKSKY